MLIDLQLHSTYSDGYLTPTELAKFVSEQGVKIAALTDHNTIGGVDEFRKACSRYRIKTITGMELYVKMGHKKFNLLWYNFDDADPDLHKMLRDVQCRRRRRMRMFLDKMNGVGFNIETEKIIDKYNHYVPLNHVIDDIMSTPFNKKKASFILKEKDPREEDIIAEFFRNKNFGILGESNVDIERVLKLRKKIGGKLILCHPAKHNYIDKERWVKLKKMGIDGVEAMSPHHSLGAIMYIQHLAREIDFIETGGSDFHRFEGGGFPIQSSAQYFHINSKYLRRINKIIR